MARALALLANRVLDARLGKQLLLVLSQFQHLEDRTVNIERYKVSSSRPDDWQVGNCGGWGRLRWLVRCHVELVWFGLVWFSEPIACLPARLVGCAGSRGLGLAGLLCGWPAGEWAGALLGGWLLA